MIPGKLLSTEEDVLEKIRFSLKNNHSLLLTYFNQNSFNVYYEDPVYNDIIDAEFSVYPDGIGIYFLNKFITGSKTDRIDATELNEKILYLLIENEIPAAIIGGSFSKKFVENQAQLLKINLSYYQDGYFRESKIPEIIEKIRISNPQVLLTGMGIPKQEIFAAKLGESLRGKVIICVGNFFEYFFGTKLRAPVFFRKAGLEWAFRLMNEPKRLWRRYLLGIPKFVYRAFRIKLSSKKEFA